MVKILAETAPAKINLFLRVTGRRADRYHELDSIFVPVSLYDRLTIELRPDQARSVALRCDDPAIGSDERNLAFRAADEFLTEFGMEAAVSLDLHKQIPAGAGLGGGSSDAGAVIRMMAALCGIDDAARLTKLALRLGADVPFFLNPTPARIGGIGERVVPLERFSNLNIVIAVPPITVSTAAVFKALRADGWSGNAPEADFLAIAEGRIEETHLVNDLERIATTKWPEIAELKGLVRGTGARAAGMTGSGGGVFGIFDSSSQALHAAERVRSVAPLARVYAVSTLHCE
ncbi:MAG TPA: 4-(cytidine 5'-diphospho)-2-C-methyl-D-erythritol kinase [Candidatus Binataceae bacterium]|nr:4-(cytidine 5'-diphospho)-2-C-methyl-D-erythritol kinase [Candidatus Binataceae bacterium]